MALYLENALIANIDPPSVRRGSVIVSDGVIREVVIAGGATGTAVPPPEADSFDCAGMVLMPGLTVGHTHLYSALAAGMPAPKRAPANFVQILEEVWWKLDRSLDDEAVRMSALVGAASAALSGATTIIDHHASPSAISGSLELVRDAIATVGLRGVLCYEVTDRNGHAGARAGIAENARFLAAIHDSRTFGGMVGAHASFTLGDATLAEIAEIADQFSAGVHIHCAEDPADAEACRAEHGTELVERLERFRILREGSVFAHCTHLTPDEIRRVQDAGAWIAHNPRSNMNNAVGYAPVAAMDPARVALGTDGIDNDMLAESKVAFFKTRDARTGLGMGDCLGWVAGASRLASSCLGIATGRVEPGSAADLVLLRYPQAATLESRNLAGHWFFGINASHVDSVMVGGRWVVRGRRFENAEVDRQLSRAAETALAVWRRYADSD